VYIIMFTVFSNSSRSFHCCCNIIHTTSPII